MERARDKFGRYPKDDGIFNAAGFSVAWKEITGLQSGLDGRAVECILNGRTDVRQMYGGSHYQVLPKPKP